MLQAPGLRLVVISLLLMTACSDSGFGDSLGQSGRRLRARLLVPDGAVNLATESVQIGWYDRTLDIDCRFTRDADGTYRCLPIQRGGLRVYSTTTCEPGTDLMALLDSPSTDGARGCSDGYVWHGHESSRCGEETSGVALRLAGPATASLASHGYVETFFGECNPRPAPPPPPDPGPSWTYCSIEEVPPERFVAARQDVRPVGPVRQRILRGEDGSRQPHALLHPDLEAELYRDGRRGTELLPDLIQLGGPLPEACPDRVACHLDEVPACAAAVLLDDGACGIAAYPVRDRVSAASDCGQDCYALGPALAPIPYQEIALGSGRLRPLWIAVGDAPLMPTGTYHDEELGVTCRPTALADGRTRCVPEERSTGSWRRVFADPDCETLLGYDYASACGEAAPIYRWRSSTEEIERMTPGEGPGADVTYTGEGPPGGPVYFCEEQAAVPATLYQPVPVDTEMVELHEVTE